MNRHMVVFCCLFLCLSCAARAEVYVAVAPFEARSTDPKGPSAALMQELVVACLSSISAIAVVERADLNTLAQEKIHALSKIHRGNRAGLQIKGARYVITGSLSPVEDHWLLSLQANDPATTRIVAAHATMLGLNFYEAEGELCGQAVVPLARDILQLRENANEYVAPEDEDNLNSTLLLQGIGYEKSGDHVRAFSHFLKILEHDPHNADATCWLAISYAGAGMQAFARKEAAKCLAEAPGHPKREDIKALLAEKTK